MEILTLTNSDNNSVRKTGILLGILVFMRTMPCYLWSMEDILRPICAILILGICLMNLSKEKWTLWIFSSIGMAYLWATVFVDHSGIVTVLNFLAFAFIPIIRQDLIFEAYKSFRKIFVFFLTLSIINYILYLMGLDVGGQAIAPLNKLKEHDYMMYPFLVTPLGISSSRFFSIYDEPGMIGNIAGMVLIAERMDFSKRGNLIIIVGGLFSLSFYFYGALIIGVILFSKKIKKKWMYIAILMGFVILTYNNDFFYNTIWHRFEFDATEGKLVGDNRNDKVVDNAFDSILGTSLFYTGMGAVMTEEYSGSASLKLIILKHGFIFVILNLLGYLLLSMRQIKSRTDLVSFFSFFILTLYQRPGFYNTSSIFLYVMVIYMFGNYAVSMNTENNNNVYYRER